MELIVALALELYKATLKTYPGLTIVLSVLFMMIAGIYYFMFRVIPARTKIFMTPYIIKEQMDTADEYLDEIENDMLSMYLRLRKEAKGCTTGLLLDQETKRFQVMAKLIMYKTKNLIRYFFRENHLTEMSTAEFNTHISDRADLIMRRLREMYNMWYICGEMPTAESFYDVFLNDYKHRMKNKLMDIFREGRDISQNFKDKKFARKYFKNL